MNIFFALFLLIILSNCSFDNKTGIWKNNQPDLITQNRFEDFETFYSEQKSFDQVVPPDDNLALSLSKIKTNLKWNDEFYNGSNNLDNFSYKDDNRIIFKSKKLTKHKTGNNILFDGNNSIITDDKGNIVVLSLENEQIIFKYNFYNKKFKKNQKILNIIIENNIIYVGDNLGYLYAVNYISGKLLWAKNYKIPFRSNLKISENIIYISNINNTLLLLDKSNGDKIKTIPTEETVVKNDYVNSLAIDKKSIFYLNTYGSIYSLNSLGGINWFASLNQSSEANPTNIFYSNPILLYKDKLIVSTDPYLYILNSKNGFTISKSPMTSIFKPIVSGENLFLITKDNLLVAINIITGKIIYSIDISQQIANFLDTKNKSISIKSFSILNDSLFIFLNNSYLVKFTSKGKIFNINKLPAKLSSKPIFINGSIIYLNNKNKLILLN